MNTVGPYHNRQETYNYYSLPFCRGDKKTISHYHETLGENIQGVELEFSGLDISFKGNLLYLNPFRRFSQGCMENQYQSEF
jgi:transmembrane 9 superfamily protein 3